jgi:hypothetical protein
MEGGQVKLRNVWSWPIVGVSRCLHVKDWGMWWLLHGGLSGKVTERMIVTHSHWGTADDRNCNYCHLKMADVESGKNLFCRLNCFYSEWHMHWYDSNLWTYHKEITNYDWKMYMKEKILPDNPQWRSHHIPHSLTCSQRDTPTMGHDHTFRNFTWPPSIEKSSHTPTFSVQAAWHSHYGPRSYVP